MKTIGIDIGGTNLRLGVFDDVSLVQEWRFQADFSAICHQHSPDTAWQLILKTIADAIETALNQYADIQAIGIGFPGFIDPQTQVIAQSPNFPGLSNVNLARDLQQMLQRKVVVENDANAAAYGEYCLIGKPRSGLIYFGLGTGVGGGMIHAGKPFVGQHGCAMEVGHLLVHPSGRQCGCGNQGCLEQYASASGVSESYFLQTKQRLTAHEIANLAHGGDGAARDAYVQAAEALATGLAHVLKVVDIPNVVIGGGMAQAWDLMQQAFEAKLDADLIPVLRGKMHVEISRCGDQAGMLGAALLALA